MFAILLYLCGVNLKSKTVNMETNLNYDYESEGNNDDNSIYLQALGELYNESYRRFEEISLSVFHYLLSGSVSLLALLVPLAILVRELESSTHLLILAGLSLSVASLLTIVGLMLSEAQCLKRKNIAQKWKDYIKGLGQRPSKEYKPRHNSWLVLAILAAVCFALAIVLLFLTLYQVFSS